MLPTPLVILEQAPDVPAEIRQATLDGCTQGLGPGHCFTREDWERSQSNGEEPYEARLIWTEDYQRVRIVVRLRSGSLEREIQFQASDRDVEKGAAAGLVAATAVATSLSLQSQNDSIAEEEVAVNAEKEAESEPLGAPTSSVTAPLKWRSDVAFNFGSGLSGGQLAFGATGRLSLSGWIKPFFPLIALSYSQSGGPVTSTRWRSWLGVGGEFALGPSPLSLELSVAGVGEHFGVATTQDGEIDRGSAWRGGVLGGLDVFWRLSQHIHPFWGGEVSLKWPDVQVSARSQPIDQQSPSSWTLHSGIRLNL